MDRTGTDNLGMDKNGTSSQDMDKTITGDTGNSGRSPASEIECFTDVTDKFDDIEQMDKPDGGSSEVAEEVSASEGVEMKENGDKEQRLADTLVSTAEQLDDTQQKQEAQTCESDLKDGDKAEENVTDSSSHNDGDNNSLLEGASQFGESTFYVPSATGNSAYNSNTPMRSSLQSVVDWDWSISFEQFMASMLTEPPLVKYFENQVDVFEPIDKFRNRRLLERSTSLSESPSAY